MPGSAEAARRPAYALVRVQGTARISGQGVSLEADLTASVQSLAERARRALGVGRGRLFSSSGSVLDGVAELRAAKLETGHCLTLQVGTVRIICGGWTRFAAILGDGSVGTWGSARNSRELRIWMAIIDSP